MNRSEILCVIREELAVAAPDVPADAGTYRLLGDPTAPLLDAPAAEAAHHPHPLEEAS